MLNNVCNNFVNIFKVVFLEIIVSRHEYSNQMVTIEELTLDEEPVEVKAPADHLSSVSISDSNAPITPDVQTSGESSEPSRHSDLLQQERMERAEAVRTSQIIIIFA